MNKQTKVLIIGANGQVGRACELEFRNSFDVYTTQRKPQEETPHQIRLDLSRTEEIKAVIGQVSPEIIINCAAYTQVDLAESEQEQANKINSDAAEAIAQSASQLGSLFIHYSTDYVFQGEGNTPHSPDDQTNPVNYYGISKLKGEDKIRTEGGLYMILRTSWVYDAEGKNFLNTMLRLGAEKKTLSIIDDQTGAPTSAQEIAKATHKAIETFLKAPEPKQKDLIGVYHLTCSGETTWFHFAKKIFEIAREYGLKLTIENIEPIATSQYPTPAKRPLNSRLDLSKFIETFSYTPLGWEEALIEVMKSKNTG